MLQAIIGVSTLFGLVQRPRVRVRGGWGHPGVWLLGVIAVLFVNQVLLNIYILGVHHGDVGFIARYVPDGWFDIADHDPVITWLAANFPAPQAFAVSIFRIPSFFELPFGMLAYLTVCRWFGPELYRRVAGLAWPMALAYTTVFSLIEVKLENPYTVQDVIIRYASAVAIALIVPKLDAPQGERVTSAKDLVLFLVSVGATGALVLAIYDTVLLYNLGRVEKQLPVAIIATVVLTATRLAARNKGTAAGPAIDTVIRMLSWFLAYFAVPALAIRYGLIFGAPWTAMIAGLAVIAAALTRTVREITVSARWALQMIGAAAAGVVAAYLGYRFSAGYPELRLLLAVTAFCAIAVTTCAGTDRLYWR